MEKSFSKFYSIPEILIELAFCRSPHPHFPLVPFKSPQFKEEVWEIRGVQRMEAWTVPAWKGRAEKEEAKRENAEK
jgi:hypothetical protein